MNLSRILIPAAWFLSIAVAFIIGAKTTPSPTQQSARSAGKSSNYASPRRRVSEDSAPSARKKAASRPIPLRSSRDLEITSIVRNDDPIARASDLLKLIGTLGASDFQAVVADFRALGITRERRGEYSMLLHAWAKIDPLGALDYAEAQTGSPFARQTILTSWATDDPEFALTWAKDHHEGEGANPWLVGVIRGLASTDSTRATEILHDLPYSRERGRALSAIIPHIARQGQEKGILWLKTITDEQLLTGATSYLAANLAKTNPEITAEWISSLSESDAKTRAAGNVAEEWAEQDFQSALAWTDTLDGSSKTNAAREIIGTYAKENPDQASAWLKTMSSEPGYAKIVESYIWNTAHTNPEASLAHIPEIQDPKAQYRYFERVLRSWKERAPKEANAWMDNHEVSKGLRKRVNR